MRIFDYQNMITAQHFRFILKSFPSDGRWVDGSRRPMVSMHPTVLNVIFLFIGSIYQEMSLISGPWIMLVWCGLSTRQKTFTMYNYFHHLRRAMIYGKFRARIFPWLAHLVTSKQIGKILKWVGRVSLSEIRSPIFIDNVSVCIEIMNHS